MLTKANTIASVTGFISPSLDGFLLDHFGQNNQIWGIIFSIAGVLLIAGGIFFGVFVSGDVQEWAKLDPDQKKNELEPLSK